jgi:hypothetical protein
MEIKLRHKVLWLGFILLLLLSVFAILSFLEITETQSNFVLDSSDAYKIRNFNLPANAKIEGSLMVNSEGNRTVWFWVTLPYEKGGGEMVHRFLANRTAEFEFITSASGYYTFRFDNEFDSQTQKSVVLSFNTLFGGVGIYASITAWVTIIIAVILLLTIIFALKTNKKKAVD